MKDALKGLIHVSFFCVLAALCYPNTPALGESASPLDPWASFHPGSWITVKEVEEVSGETRTATVRRKVTSKKDGLAEVWNFTEDGSQRLMKERSPSEGNSPKTLFMRQKSASEARVRVGDHLYRTEKISYVPEGKFSLARGPLTMYYTDQLNIPYRELILCGDTIALPENVVRAEYTAPDRNSGRLMRFESQVVFFYSMVPVGDEKIPCFLEETKVIDVSSSRQVGLAKRWLSPKIPGHTVKLEYHFESPYGPAKMERTVQNYQRITFRTRSIEMFGNRISFDIPEQFRNVPPGDPDLSEWGPDTHTRVFRTDDSRASVIIQASEPSVLVHKVSDLNISMEKRLSRQIPDLRPIRQGFIEINGRDFLYHEYISGSGASELHTYSLSTLHRGKILSLAFDAVRDILPEYEQLRRIWLGTIKIE